MKCNRIGLGKVTGLGIVLGLAVVLVLAAASNSLAAPKPIKYKASGNLTFVTAFFSYDGVSSAVYVTGSGKDNLGGSATVQAVGEFGPATVTTCTAPDGTAGLEYELDAANSVGTYTTGDQVFSSAVASPGNLECLSNTTGSFGATVTYTVDGGTGKFATASGSVTVTVTGNLLAAPLGGAGGLFGAEHFTSAGSVTK